MIKEFLDGQKHQINRANWTVVCEPSKFSDVRYWMVQFPRCENGDYVTFIWERNAPEGMVFEVGTDKRVSLHDLQFWYDAQRQPGDW